MHKDTDAAQPGRNVIIFANCHGWVVRHAIKGFAPDFNHDSAVHFIPNFTDDYQEFLDVVKNCDFFLFQTEKGEEIERKFAELSALLPEHAQVVRFPMVGFNVFWPTVFQDYSALPDTEGGAINFHFADRQVIRLWKQGVPADAIVETILSSAPATPDVLQRSLEFWTDSYRSQETGCDVGISDIILAMVFSRETFYWPTHCCNAVVFTMVDRILTKLGKAPLVPEAAQAADSLHDWELPIHPAVAETFGLDYVHPDRAYLMPDGRRLTHEEYLRAYIAYLPRRYGEAATKAHTHDG